MELPLQQQITFLSQWSLHPDGRAATFRPANFYVRLTFSLGNFFSSSLFVGILDFLLYTTFAAL
jgi:hypothetical protein